jgi:signal transduction histidine kinase
MRLAHFILSNIDGILEDWDEFARTRGVAAFGLTELTLRNDAEALLHEVVRDMGSRQTSDEQHVKSRGEAIDVAGDGSRPAQAHALQRARNGFEVNQMVSEFRALRATVLRRWARDAGSANIEDLMDVTRFNEAIDQALAESLKHFVGEVDRARSLLLGTLGHDLRTPLSTIGTCATILTARNPENAREAAMIQRSAARMRDLVEGVLAYTRTSLGVVLPVVTRPMRLDELVRDCVKELALTNSSREIHLTITGDSQGLWDSVRLGQLTSNMVGNALKYGTPDRSVNVSLDGTQPDEVLLKVQNFGEPIKAEFLRDIFEPLVRGPSAEAADQIGGANMGLGLYIAREVVSAHFGSIQVTSDEDAGTIFTVRLPRAPQVPT